MSKKNNGSNTRCQAQNAKKLAITSSQPRALPLRPSAQVRSETQKARRPPHPPKCVLRSSTQPSVRAHPLRPTARASPSRHRPAKCDPIRSTSPPVRPHPRSPFVNLTTALLSLTSHLLPLPSYLLPKGGWAGWPDNLFNFPLDTRPAFGLCCYQLFYEQNIGLKGWRYDGIGRLEGIREQ